MADWGIKVAKSGFSISEDLLTDAWAGGSTSMPNPQGLIFNSGWFAYKVLSVGSLQKSVASSAGNEIVDSVSIAHGLDYVPTAMLYWGTDNATWYPSNTVRDIQPVGLPILACMAQTTATDLTAEIFSVDHIAVTMYIRYVIFAEVGSS